ncbi:MAG: ABC transporter permease [Bacillota bacterium]
MITITALLKRIKHDPITIMAGLVLMFVVFLALFGSYITPYDPYNQDLSARLQVPSEQHMLGTDAMGRDILSRLIIGARYSLLVGFVSIAIGLSFGIVLGILSGYYRGVLDMMISRFIDILMAFPTVLLAIVVLAILGPGLYNTMIAVGIWSIPMFTRLIRGSVMSIRERGFVTAAVSCGASNIRIMFRHIIPNLVPTLVVLCTIRMSTAILSAAGLGFIGLGAPPNFPEWGTMLSDAKSYLRAAPHLVYYPGLAIMITALAFNLLGDALRDALDPYLKD